MPNSRSRFVTLNRLEGRLQPVAAQRKSQLSAHGAPDKETGRLSAFSRNQVCAEAFLRFHGKNLEAGCLGHVRELALLENAHVAMAD